VSVEKLRENEHATFSNFQMFFLFTNYSLLVLVNRRLSTY